jgi:hypothetical protein
MNYDNPAARLLEILEMGKKYSKGQNCRFVWNEILSGGDDNAILMTRLGMVMALPSQAVQALKDNFPQRHKAWEHWPAQVNAGFMHQNLQGEWKSFSDHIDPHTINYLHLAVELLEAKSNTKTIVDEEIKSVRLKLQSVYDEVIAGDIESDLKKTLIRYLRKIIVCIDEYFLTGALPILEAADTVFGHAFVDEKYRSFLFDEELGKKILDTVAATANVVAIATGLPQLTTTLRQLLPL